MTQPLEAAPTTVSAVHPTLVATNHALHCRGHAHQVIAGSMHYFRVHPAQWQDRMSRLADLGVNALHTPVAWNFHEAIERRPRFDDWRDIERYLLIARDAGLDVIVQPGPYIDAGWDNGGLPAWLRAREGIRLSSVDLRYLSAVERWFDELVPRLARLQSSGGGPLIAVQSETRHGPDVDPKYSTWLTAALRDRGIVELIYDGDSADDPSRSDSFPYTELRGVLAELGNERDESRAQDARRDVESILARDGSMIVFMAHGGTGHGLWQSPAHDDATPGATDADSAPQVPIAQNGAPTPTYFALQEILWPGAGTGMPSFFPPPRAKLTRVLSVERGAGLLEAVQSPVEPPPALRPPSFEQLGLGAGMVLYRAERALLRGVPLRVTGLHDRAFVFIDGRAAGVIDGPEGMLDLGDTTGEARLDLLVENCGRASGGPLLGQHKGILGDVMLGDDVIEGWSAVPIALDRWDDAKLLALAAGAPEGTAGVAVTRLEVDHPADASLMLPGFGSGFVWINGFLLGRYRSREPELSLYVPAPLLRPGVNTVTILELEHCGTAIEWRSAGILQAIPAAEPTGSDH